MFIVNPSMVQEMVGSGFPVALQNRDNIVSFSYSFDSEDEW